MSISLDRFTHTAWSRGRHNAVIEPIVKPQPTVPPQPTVSPQPKPQPTVSPQPKPQPKLEEPNPKEPARPTPPPSPTPDVPPPCPEPKEKMDSSRFTTYNLRGLIPDYVPSNEINADDWRKPEYEPNNWQPPKETEYSAYWNHPSNPLPTWIAKTQVAALQYLQALRMCFYKSEFEEVLSFTGDHVALRATQSWGIIPAAISVIYGTNKPYIREYIYAIPNDMAAQEFWIVNALKSWFGVSEFRKLIFEGIWRSEEASIVKVYELVPRLFLERTREIQSEFDLEFSKIIRRSYVILDSKDFGSDERGLAYLNKLSQDIENLVDKAEFNSSKLIHSPSGAPKTTFRKIQEKLDEAIEETFKGVDNLNRDRYQVDSLKNDFCEFFTLTDRFAKFMREAKTISQNLKIRDVREPNAQELRERLFKIVKELYENRDASWMVMNELERQVDSFEEKRSKII